MVEESKGIRVHTFFIGVIAIAVLAAACATPVSDDAISGQESASPVETFPQMTSPVTTSPIVETQATTVPSTTAPVTVTEPSTAPAGGETDATAPERETPTVTTQPPKESPVTVTPVQPVDPNPSGPVAAAVADLTIRLGIDPSDITVVSVEEVTWPDGSIGCPQPGMRYTQALVNGSLVTLEAGGQTYEYHSGGGRSLFYCANPTPPTSGNYGDN